MGKALRAIARVPKRFAVGVGRASSTLFEIAGLGVFAYGVSMVYVPAGVIAAGAALCFIGYASGER